MATFADMMTLLLGFFMILYSLSNMDEKRFYEFGKAISESVTKDKKVKRDEIFEDLAVDKKQIKAFQMLVAVLNLQDPSVAYEKIASLYEDYLVGESSYNAISTLAKDAKGQGFLKELSVARDAYITIVTIPLLDIFPSRRSTQVKRIARAQLRKVALALSNLSQVSETLIEVHHQDSGQQSNLSSLNQTGAQANTLVNLMVERGVEQKRILGAGRGSNVPRVKPGSSPTGKSNDRIEIKIRSLK